MKPEVYHACYSFGFANPYDLLPMFLSNVTLVSFQARASVQAVASPPMADLNTCAQLRDPEVFSQGHNHVLILVLGCFHGRILVQTPMGLSGPREDLVTMETIRYFLYLVLLLKMGMLLPVFHQGLQTQNPKDYRGRKQQPFYHSPLRNTRTRQENGVTEMTNRSHQNQSSHQEKTKY